MIIDLLDIAQGLLGFKDSFAKAKRDRKDRIAEYFLKLGNIIQETADVIKEGNIPHGKCQQILDHAQNFSNVVGDTIEKDKAEAFQNKLIDSHKVELIASEILGINGSSEDIIELEKISGSFISLGDIIKASK
jgi:hypothetical protein